MTKLIYVGKNEEGEDLFMGTDNEWKEAENHNCGQDCNGTHNAYGDLCECQCHFPKDEMSIAICKFRSEKLKRFA